MEPFHFWSSGWERLGLKLTGLYTFRVPQPYQGAIFTKTYTHRLWRSHDDSVLLQFYLEPAADLQTGYTLGKPSLSLACGCRKYGILVYKDLGTLNFILLTNKDQCYRCGNHNDHSTPKQTVQKVR